MVHYNYNFTFTFTMPLDLFYNEGMVWRSGLQV